MLILARYCRKTRLGKGVRTHRNQNSYLFDPVYGIGRDHIRCNKFTGPRRQKARKAKGLTKGWYVIRGSREKYTDARGNEKSSIIIDNYFRLF